MGKERNQIEGRSRKREENKRWREEGRVEGGRRNEWTDIQGGKRRAGEEGRKEGSGMEKSGRRK